MPKVVWIWPGFEPFLAPFWDLEAFFSESFFYVFLEVPFSLPGRLLGTNGSQKASKMKPKWKPTSMIFHTFSKKAKSHETIEKPIEF